MSRYKYWLVLLFLFGLTSSIKAQTLLKGTGRTLFDNHWRFHLGDMNDASDSAFKDADWRIVDLPHDWSIEGEMDVNNPSGNAGGFFPDGTGWYRKTFRVPLDWNGKELSVYFGGVYMNAEVFINGHSLGIHPYGFTAFGFDLTPYIRFGQNNVLAVKVDNSSQVNCRWYTGSGIYRHVWFCVKDQVHIDTDPSGVYITTPEISAAKALVRIRSTVKNTAAAVRQVRLTATLFAPGSRPEHNGQKVGTASREVTLPPHSETRVVQEIVINRPKLWDLETPDLYTAKLEIRKDRQEVQQIETDFGIRSIRFSADSGFQLNGRMVKLNGGCLHADNGCLGAAAYDRAEQRKVELLKAAGFNAVRTAHNPPSIAFLDACDRLGLLVIDEAFDGWRTAKNKYDYALYFDDWWKRDLDAMMLRDRNHPSIIMWSIGNEIIERKEPQAVRTARMLVAEVKLKDPTRPVTSAMTTWDKDWTIFDALMAAHDVAGYNYQLQRAPADHLRVPSRVIAQTESYPRDAYANWKLVENHSYIIGDFVWTAMDYLGESSIGRYYYPGEPQGQHWERSFFPWHGSYCGDIDLMGDRKPISYYRSLLYNGSYNGGEKLYLAVREPNPPSGAIRETMWSVWPTWESWTWPAYEGKPIDVEIYSRYPGVRLYLNGELIGEKAVSDSTAFKAVFSVPYQAGILKAVGLENGREVAYKTLQTAGPVAGIRLTADRKQIVASGQDLSYIKVELVDENGHVQPDSDNRLHFDIKGAGAIAGVDNANLKDPDRYHAKSRKAWKGKALVVVRSTRESGNILLTVTADGLPASATATLTIRSEAPEQ